MKNGMLSFFLFMLHAPFCVAQSQTDSLLMALDQAIANSCMYEKTKTERIELIKEALEAHTLAPEEEYVINLRICHEYESYSCDSARHYINRNIQLATRLGHKEWLNESTLKKAHILATSGLYAEGLKLLESIDKQTLSHKLLASYYTTFKDMYLYLAEYAQNDEYTGAYLHRMSCYRDSVLQVIPKGSYAYVIVKAPSLVDNQQLQEAKDLLLAYLPQLSPDTRDYAVLTSILAFIYQNSNEPAQRKAYLIRSAMADIKAVVKENSSLRSLAEVLHEQGEVEHANNYMKQSMADATFYNARLRNVQVSKLLPIIDHAYQVEKEMQRKKLQLFLIVISILSFFLIVAIIYVIRQMKKLSRTRKEVEIVNRALQQLNTNLTQANLQQKLTNASLTEANCIKEEYIGRFLGLCSTYIDKLEMYRRMLNRKAASGKVEELYKTLKSSQFIDDELKEFYHNFDNSFLKIFPDFVQCFNQLLPQQDRIVPKQGELLTTELRIFALIRLGITDSATIAGFLRYSITTIYTYRSKLRNKSLFRDTFEEQVTKIGSFKAEL